MSIKIIEHDWKWAHSLSTRSATDAIVIHHAAAVSNNLTHAAILFSAEGFPVMHQCYKHPNAQPTPEGE